MAAPAFSWANYQDNAFRDPTTTTNVGSTGAAGSNGAFTAGNLLIAQLIIGGTGHTMTPPAGWDIIGAKVADANGNEGFWYAHVCDGSESGSFTFSWTGSGLPTWALACYSGVAAAPIDDDLVTAWAETGGVTTFTTGSVVPVETTDLLVLWATGDDAVTKPADMTSRIAASQNSGTVVMFLADRALSAPGSVFETFGVVGFKNGSYALIALKPTAAAPGGRAIHLKDSWS